jgi:hypothetical protein
LQALSGISHILFKFPYGKNNDLNKV